MKMIIKTFPKFALFSAICLFKFPTFIINKAITAPVIKSVTNTAIKAAVVAFFCIGFTAIFHIPPLYLLL